MRSFLLYIALGLGLAACGGTDPTPSTYLIRIGTDADGVVICVQKNADGSRSMPFPCPKL